MGVMRITCPRLYCIAEILIIIKNVDSNICKICTQNVCILMEQIVYQLKIQDFILLKCKNLNEGLSPSHHFARSKIDYQKSILIFPPHKPCMACFNGWGTAPDPSKRHVLRITNLRVALPRYWFIERYGTYVFVAQVSLYFVDPEHKTILNISNGLRS